MGHLQMGVTVTITSPGDLRSRSTRRTQPFRQAVLAFGHCHLVDLLSLDVERVWLIGQVNPVDFQGTSGST